MRTILTSNTPKGRWAQVEELAGPAVFLCSDAAEHVHGATLFVDGGWNAVEGVLTVPSTLDLPETP